MMNFLRRRFRQERLLLAQDGWRTYYWRLLRRILILNFWWVAQRSRRQDRPQGLTSILLISGCPGTVAEIHRVFHLEEKLKSQGLAVTVVSHPLLMFESASELVKADLLYIHRAANEAVIQSLIKAFQAQGKKVIFDIDDLVFDESIMGEISAIRGWPQEDLELYRTSVKRYFELMQMVDVIVTPTKYLSDRTHTLLHKPTFVLQNGVDSETYKKALRIRKSKRVGKTITIGYFPGTKTHEEDFAVCKKALLRLLRELPQLHLRIVGPLDRSTEFDAFSDRVVWKALVPYEDLISEYRSIDISIAPLELNNAFCEGKSELKYYFAGLCGIPSVASSTATYKQVIQDGVNGFLAKTTEEWQAKLKQLIVDREVYDVVAHNAYQDCKKTYDPEHQARNIVRSLVNITKI